MEALTGAVTSAIAIVGQGIDFIIAEPILLIPVGVSLLMTGVGIFKSLV